jgi:EAL and modified HD-GYP domain-containing signal transduction protein
MKDSDATTFEPFFVARQPVFTKRMDIWGYELLFRHCLEARRAQFTESEEATCKVLSEGLSVAQKGLKQQAKFLINFPRKAFIDEYALLFSPDRVCIEFLEDIIPDRNVLKACLDLKRKGYSLVLDDYQGQREYKELFKLVDMVKVDVQGLSQEQLEAVVNKVRQNSRGLIVAEKVETREMFKLTKKLGCDLFQGFFFSEPEIIPGKSIPGNKIVKLNLLEMLSHQKTYDLKQLTQVIKSDLSLSYRLLRYINSPYIGLPHKVQSIKHAINMLGYKRLLRWLRIQILAELNATKRGQELCMRSAQRGRFLELMAGRYMTPFPSESMFLIGLFSLLDAILDQPMDDILKSLPLTQQMAETLKGEFPKGSAWLELVQAQEYADWEGLQTLIGLLGLSPEFTAECYIQAMQWSSDLLQSDASS